MTALGDALYGAGMEELFTVTSRQRDDEVPPQDVLACATYPDWHVQAAWKAIRRSISPDSPVYAKSSTIRRGDLKGLIRTVRFFFERNTVNVQHEILGKIRHTLQADYPNFRGYVAAWKPILSVWQRWGKDSLTTSSATSCWRALQKTFAVACTVPF